MWFCSNGFRGRRGICFRKIAGSAAQIFENLVGREVEVMLMRLVMFAVSSPRGYAGRDQATNSSV